MSVDKTIAKALILTVVGALAVSSFGLVSLSSISHAEPLSTSCLVERMQESLSAKPKTIEVPSPKSISLIYSPKQAKAYFEAASLFVDQEFHRKEILSALDEIIAGQPLSPPTTKRLAEVRKALKTLRFAYQAFDVRHEIPKEMDHLIIVLGHMDDGLKANAPEVAQSIALDIKKQLKKKRLDELFRSVKKLKPETEKGFWRWESSARAAMQKALAAPDVTAEEFHEVRKTLGRYFTVLNAQHVYHPTEGDQSMLQFTNKLYQDLGDFHDKLEADKVEKLQHAMDAPGTLSKEEKRKIEDDAKDLRVQFTPELRTGLNQFLDSLREH